MRITEMKPGTSDRKQRGPGPKFWQEYNNRKGKDTDSPASPIDIRPSDDEAEKPKRTPTKHHVEVDVDGFAEVYADSSGFLYKGGYIHTRERAEVQNTGEITVFRRTQEMEGNTDTIMREVLKRMTAQPKADTVAESTDSNVTFAADPADLARDKRYATDAEVIMVNLNRQFVSAGVQTDTVVCANGSAQTYAKRTANASTQTDPATPRSSSSSSDSSVGEDNNSDAGRPTVAPRRTKVHEVRSGRDQGSTGRRPHVQSSERSTATRKNEERRDKRKRSPSGQRRESKRERQPPPMCLFCNADHPLCRCEQFRELDVDARWRVVTESVERPGGCAQCFRMSHTTRRCWCAGCPQCGGRHNSLLCKN